MFTGKLQRSGMLIRISLLVVFSVLSLHGQSVAESSNKTCLWKLKSQKNTVYFIGSIHLLKKEAYPLAEGLERAFNDSQAVVFETDLDVLTQESIQKLILSKGLYSTVQNLTRNITKETYDLVQKKAEELGFDIKQFETFKPWFLAMTLSVFKLKQMGFDTGYGVDQYFFDKTKKAGKEIITLESPEYQIDRLADLSAPLQEAMLIQTLKDLDMIEKEMDKIIKAWTTGDTSILEATLLKSLKEYPEVYRRLVIERNKNWLPKIEGFVGREKNYLVIVGVGHLIGEDSVIRLLEKKGYSLEQ